MGLDFKDLSFLGAGNMARAFIGGIIGCGAVPEQKITIIDGIPQQYNNYIMYNINIAKDYFQLCDNAEFVFIATKPADVKNALELIKQSGADISKTTFVSFCAAVPTDYIATNLGIDAPVIRLMPSTPMLVGMGAVAIAKNQFVKPDAYDKILALLKQISVVAELDEAQMNNIIAVNGSSPAYVYLFVKAMVEGARSLGIEQDQSLPLILKTIEGSIEMIRRSDEDIDTLIRRVAAPKGTTLEALKSFENDNFITIVKNAMDACTKRADEITAELP